MSPRSVFLVTALPLLIACGPAEAPQGRSPEAAPPASSAPRPPGVLVSASWLKAHREAPGLVVVDAREPEAYAAGHIAGAIELHYRRTFDPSPTNAGNVAPLQRINELLGAAGIDRSGTVVVYADDGDYRPAAWLFWVLELYGHPAIAVLDGGLPAWRRSSGPVSTEPTRLPPARFVGQLSRDRLADKLEVCRAMRDGASVILDARELPEYLGDKKDNAAARAGHIPTALVRPATAHSVRGEGYCSFQDPEAIRAACGDLRGRRVLTYCNTGRSAAVSYLALRSIGIDVAVYDGAWVEWSADELLPVEVGPSPQQRGGARGIEPGR